jgi:4-amino-4-deoxy-L-arabinose transferase-like glycosyltransferase
MNFIRRNLDLLLLFLLVAGFAFIAAMRLGSVPVPETDEAYTLQVAYEVVNHGKIALPMYRYLGGNIENAWHSYTPVYFVLLGGFFKLFGWGLAQGRAFNLITALFTLVMMYAIARKHFNWRAAIIAGFLLISDVTFLERARMLRNDYTAAGFALLAFYLYEIGEAKGQAKWFIGAGLATGAGVMCHTNDLYIFGAILLLMLCREGWRLIKRQKLYLFIASALAVMAYEIIFSLVDRDNFLAQNREDKLHFQILEGGGWWQNLLLERKRYQIWFAGDEMFPGVPRTLLHIFQLLTVLSLIYLFFRLAVNLKKPDLFGDFRNRVLLITLLLMAFLTILGGNKDIYYIAHLAPWFAICAGIMLSDLCQWMAKLKEERAAYGLKWRVKEVYGAGIGLILVVSLFVSYQFAKQYWRYFKSVRAAYTIQIEGAIIHSDPFAEVKKGVREMVPSELCPVAMKAPVVWLMFTEQSDCFATIEDRTKSAFEADTRDYALIMLDANQRARSRWTEEFDKKYHLLGELTNTVYGDIRIYYTGKNENYLQLAPKQDTRLFEDRGGGYWVITEPEK